MKALFVVLAAAVLVGACTKKEAPAPEAAPAPVMEATPAPAMEEVPAAADTNTGAPGM